MAQHLPLISFVLRLATAAQVKGLLKQTIAAILATEQNLAFNQAAGLAVYV